MTMSKEINVTGASGRYSLNIKSVATKPGCWNFTVGTITRADGTVIAAIERNYSSFPYLFVEDHPDGHDYMVCGKDYQGQTVVQLDTGLVKDYVPAEAKQGAGFCWTSYKWDRDFKLLVVNGCYWACPYELRFYDFANPMNGWPLLDIEGDPDENYIDDDTKEPLLDFAKNEITCFDTSSWDSSAWNDEEENTVLAYKVFKREGDKLVFVRAWMDDKEAEIRKKRMDDNAAWEAAWEEYKKTDEIYLLVNKRIDESALLLNSYVTIGQCYPSWCPDFTGLDSRICRTIGTRALADGKKISIDLEWGRKEAPIKLVLFVDGKNSDVFWFERTVDGMNKALDLAEQKLK